MTAHLCKFDVLTKQFKVYLLIPVPFIAVVGKKGIMFFSSAFFTLHMSDTTKRDTGREKQGAALLSEINFGFSFLPKGTCKNSNNSYSSTIHSLLDHESQLLQRQRNIFK